MKQSLRLSRAADLVKAFEVFEPRAVRGPNGVLAIGYGHTLTAREGAEVDREEAESLLIYDLSRTAEAVEACLQTPVNSNQLEALTAFAFNIGLENFRGSTTLRRLNAGDHLGAAREIERWRRAQLAGETQVVDSLVRRRAAEKARFLTPPEGFPKSATPVLRPEFDPDPDPVVCDDELHFNRRDEVTSAVAHLPEPGSDTGGRPGSDADADASTETDARIEADANLEQGLQTGATEHDAAPPPPFVSLTAGEGFEPPFPANESVQTARSPAPRAADRIEADEFRMDPFSTIKPTSFALMSAAAQATTREPLQTGRLSGRDLLTSVNARRAILSLGGVGLLLFAGAVLSILNSRPGGLNLALGLVGVLCIAPTAYVLLGPGRNEAEGGE